MANLKDYQDTADTYALQAAEILKDHSADPQALLRASTLASLAVFLQLRHAHVLDATQAKVGAGWTGSQLDDRGDLPYRLASALEDVKRELRRR